MIKTSLIAILLFLPCYSALAGLIEIANYGGDSTSVYFERITKDDPEQNSDIGQPLNSQQVSEYALNKRLPINSQLLKPGRVKAKKWPKPAFIGTTIALIGYDRLSLVWLKKNKTRLEKNGTQIMLVSVKTQQQIKKIQAYLPKNTVLPMSGDEVARQLGVTHYPILITSQGIEQ